MTNEGALSTVRTIMTEFAAATGLSPVRVPPRRYLWTDAFGVCNFLGLYSRTREEKYRRLALQLVDQVHAVLGRHREDDTRRGWISGLGEEEGRLHPTIGGLRIGKNLKERMPDEPFDDSLEWERDGQYYHYLTKWMRALDSASRVTGDLIFSKWAVELAKTAQARFVYGLPRGHQKRMYWKMSIDLSYPLVSSMGHHDPLDGLIVYSLLQSTAALDGEKAESRGLSAEIAEMKAICAGKEWTTDDPLGIGGLLSDAFIAARLFVNGNSVPLGLIEGMLKACLPGLESYYRENPLRYPAGYRLAFRELGLSMGLRALEELARLAEENESLFEEGRELNLLVKTLSRYIPMHDKIEDFWLEPANRQSEGWIAHGDINMVMLATSLAPDGYLTV
jgi:hypothetical protein